MYVCSRSRSAYGGGPYDLCSIVLVVAFHRNSYRLRCGALLTMDWFSIFVSGNFSTCLRRCSRRHFLRPKLIVDINAVRLHVQRISNQYYPCCCRSRFCCRCCCRSDKSMWAFTEFWKMCECHAHDKKQNSPSMGTESARVSERAMRDITTPQNGK